VQEDPDLPSTEPSTLRQAQGGEQPPTTSLRAGSSDAQVPAEVPLPFRRRLRDWLRAHKTATLVLIFFGVTIPWYIGQKIRVMIAEKKEQAAAAKAAQESVEAVPVNVMEVKLGRFQDTLTALGTIAGGSEIEIRFPVEGTIDQFNFKEGDKVKKGDIIAQLSPQEARLKLEKARLELDQYEKLYALGGVSKSRLEEARLAMDLAESEYEKTMLKAPRSGIIGDKSAEVGEFVTSARKIVTLVSIETAVVKVGIIEKNIDKVYPGQSVLVTVDTYPGTVFEGKIENISPMVQGTSKTLSVEARLKNDGGLLLPGMFARTKIVTYEADNALIIPNDALSKTASGFQVFVIGKENKAALRDVDVGYVSNEFTQVTKGLSPGELVVVQRPSDLRDGSPVKVIEVQQ
jgi:membrane fusion protein (multidrug efflux system)